MRRTKPTYYSLRRLHRLLALAALALLATTIWMIVADHRREWKRYQRIYRDQVAPWINQMQGAQDLARPQDEAQQSLPAHHATPQQLAPALAQQQPSLTKRLLGLPLIDAFGRPLAIEQLWLPDLTIDYNFRRVARFDRCLTCHQGIDQMLSADAIQMELSCQQQLTLQLITPAALPESESTQPVTSQPPSLERIYGLRLAQQGMLDHRAPTVQIVLPKTPAALARLRPGDTILKIDDHEPADRAAAQQCLLEPIQWGKPRTLMVRRGLPHPYAAHPRLDLFVGSHSPHPVAEFGCTICHQGQGSATEFKWASHTPNDPSQRARWRQEHGWSHNPCWDFPMLPRRFAESRCLLCHHEVTDLEPSPRFPDPPAPRLVAGYHLVRQYGCFGCHEINGISETGQSLGPDMRLEPINTPSANVDVVPTLLRRVGPSLRDVRSRLQEDFLADWMAQPARFMPTSRMPQLFGLLDHLQDETLRDTRRFQAVEIRAIAAYLLSASHPVAPQPAPSGLTEPPSADRGKRLFELHGCLACHQHADFPQSQATQGPALTNAAAKYSASGAGEWLTSWIRDPSRHAPRTLMPNPLLEPVTSTGEAQDDAPAAQTRISDPAADIAAYLLTPSKHSAWQPQPLPPLVAADLDELALLHLRRSYPAQLAQQYLRQGIPPSLAGQVSGDAAVLVGPITAEKKLKYVGLQTMRKRGCFGCHDIPGLEDAQPIGPALTDWGRKHESLLAFEQIDRFLEQSGEASTASADPDRGFFIGALLSHRREGFIWQKLQSPRSFDYKTADNKGFNEQLLMGRFTLTQQQCEAIMTFVLGLVADPPAQKYLYRPDPRQKAIVEGRKVLDKYACAQCHTLEMERWTFDFDPSRLQKPRAQTDYDFLQPQFSADQIAASKQTDNRGLCRAEVTGMPRVDAQGQLLADEDEDGNPLHFFTLWEPAAIHGEIWPVGGAEVSISQNWITRKRPPQGGALARLLYPVVLAQARQAGSTATEVEAWGWVPPPLVHEGALVQPAWLHEYLLQPTVIRPAAVLRMPRYNLSAAEAGKLVDYFAAKSGVDFPYTSPQKDRHNLALPQIARREKAMKLITDTTTYCAKCHLIGDFTPGGQTRTILAPNLDQTARRLRPAYIRRWLANPRSALPYTAMPVNFPPTGPSLGQDLFPGTSREQLDAVIDLLLDYDGYARSQISIRRLVRPESVPQAPTEPVSPSAAQ